jgi:hypothetical protein
LTSYCFTNTHGQVVVVRQNVCGVPVWTCIRDISMFAAVGRKLRASKQRKVDCVCINVLFAHFDVLLLHKYTWEGSGCETECVWGTCMDTIPGYLGVYISWAEVESIKAAKSRLCV